MFQIALQLQEREYGYCSTSKEKNKKHAYTQHFLIQSGMYLILTPSILKIIASQSNDLILFRWCGLQISYKVSPVIHFERLNNVEFNYRKQPPIGEVSNQSFFSWRDRAVLGLWVYYENFFCPSLMNIISHFKSFHTRCNTMSGG